jgi:hypothetical protein
MRLSSAAKLSPLDFLAILPALARLVGTVVEALSASSDGGKRVTSEELAQIGADLVAIVQAVIPGR